MQVKNIDVELTEDGELYLSHTTGWAAHKRHVHRVQLPPEAAEAVRRQLKLMEGVVA